MSGTNEDVDPLVERILGEGRLSMAAVARKLGSYRQGKAVHGATVTRWAVAGVTLPDGRVIKLETIRFNGALATSWPAVLRFFSAQQQRTGAAPGETETNGGLRSRTAKWKAAEVAGRELEGLGA